MRSTCQTRLNTDTGLGVMDTNMQMDRQRDATKCNYLPATRSINMQVYRSKHKKLSPYEGSEKAFRLVTLASA